MSDQSDQERPEPQPDMAEQTDEQRSGPRKHVERAGPQAGGSRISRRELLVGAGVVAVGGALAVGEYTRATLSASAASALPPPGQSGIEHIVLVMMENRSFDHFLGWLPGANGEQAGLSYPDPAGTLHPTYPLAPDYQGCGHPDPDHSYSGGRVQYDDGRCDGWLLDTSNDIYSIGYYTQNDLAFLGQAATAWTVCDNYQDFRMRAPAL
jgi:phospholipase C